MLNIGELALDAATRLSASDGSREYTLEIKTVKRKKEKIFHFLVSSEVSRILTVFFALQTKSPPGILTFHTREPQGEKQSLMALIPGYLNAPDKRLLKQRRPYRSKRRR